MSQPSLQTREVPCGQGGLNRLQNLTIFPITDLQWCESLTVENITWQKMAGAAAYLNSALAGKTILGLWDFWDRSFVQHTVAALNDGTLVVLTPTGIAATLTTGLTGLTNGSGFPMFSEGWVGGSKKSLFFSDGYDAPLTYDPVTFQGFVGVTSGAADWSGTTQPAMIFAHKSRMIALLNHTAYFSDPAAQDSWSQAVAPNSIQFAVYPGEADKLVGGISFRQRAYLLKSPRGLYMLDDTDPNLQNWGILKLTDSIGVPGPGCVVATDEDVYLLDSEGYFHALSAVYTFRQEAVPPLFPRELSDFIRNNVNMSQLALTRSVYYARKRLVIFALPGTGATICNRYLMFDLNLPGKPRVLWSSRDECPALATRRNGAVQEPMIGDSTGQVWRLDQAARDKGSVGYTGQYESPTFSLLEDGVRRANLEELQVVFHPVGNWNLTLEIEADGTVLQALTVSMNTPGAPVGSISLDSDVLGGTVISNGVQRLHGDAKYLKLIGRNTTADQNFSVMNHIVRFKPGRYSWA